MAEDHHEDLDALNPTVVRLSKELKEALGNGRLMKKNWRQSQADHQAAAVEVSRLTKELALTVQALSTSQEIEARLEEDLGVKQRQFMLSDVRASGINNEMINQKKLLTAAEVVEKKYTADLLVLRNDTFEQKSQVKELTATQKKLKAEILHLQERAQKAEVEVKQLRVETARCKTSEQEARARAAEISRRCGTVTEEMHESERNRKDIEVYAERMRENAELVSSKYEEEKKLVKSLTAQLKTKTHDHLSERDKCLQAKIDLKEEQSRTLGLRKDKSDIQNVAMGVNRNHSDLVKDLAERDGQIELLKQTIEERTKDIHKLTQKVKDSEAEIKKLTKAVRAEHTKATMTAAVADTAKKDFKMAVEEASGVRKEVAAAQNYVMTVARELKLQKVKTKESDSHSVDCEEVIGRLTGDIAKEQQKVLETEALVETFKKKLNESEDRYHASLERIADLEGSVQAISEEVGLVRRAEKDSTVTVSKLGTVIHDYKANLNVSESEVGRVSEMLEKYRKDLVDREHELEVEKAKVIKHKEETLVEKHKVQELHEVVISQKKEMEIMLELEHNAERTAETSLRATEALGHELHRARNKQKAAELELAPVVDMSQREAVQISDLEGKMLASEVFIESLKKDVATNLKRALDAEAINSGHEKMVAELEEVAAHAKGHDHTASALTTKMATRLLEAQKKVPPLEQEVAVYKDQTARTLMEMDKLKEKMPRYEKDLKRLTKELSSSKLETAEWRSKITAVEAQIPPLSEKLMFTQSQLRDEEALKKELVQQLHANRKRTAEAEEQAKELTKHVQTMVEQLKNKKSDRDPNEPKSPKSPSSPKSFLQRVRATPQLQSPKIPARALLKGSDSLPALKP